MTAPVAHPLEMPEVWHRGFCMAVAAPGELVVLIERLPGVPMAPDVLTVYPFVGPARLVAQLPTWLPTRTPCVIKWLPELASTALVPPALVRVYLPGARGLPESSVIPAVAYAWPGYAPRAGFYNLGLAFNAC